ncbi:hypothetical protein PILCRDRAFT_15061 [Piloderma croceum F 1598]|uniref:Uncharacterized protein n=1 Tax=Piloderma croceum (strain F 1598) TaxID=765440 RepID=A0A0C3EM33_PILCF|nr:hypothetical protein PILCRDRAFT_15061 [Piloderma croceum F 1598]
MSHRVTSPNVAQHSVTSPSIVEHCGALRGTIEHRATSCDTASRRVTSPNIAKHRVTSCDITEHRPTLHTVPTPSSDIPSHSPVTTDHFSSHSAYGLCGTLESIVPHRNMCILSPVHSDIALTVDISDSRLSTTSRIKAIECELAQLRNHAKVTPHSAYCAPESADVSDHDADPAIIFRQSA